MAISVTTEIYRHRLTSPDPFSAPESRVRWTFNRSQKRIFPTGNSGIEVLTAVIQNEVNKAGTLEMDVILNDDDLLVPYRDFISVSDKYVSTTNNTTLERDILFFGRVISVTVDGTSTSHITCEGYLACLADCPMTSHNKNDPFKIPTGGWLQSQFSIAVETYSELLKRGDVKWECKFSKQYEALDSEVSISLGTSCGDFIISTLVNTYGGVVYLKRSSNSIPFGNGKLTVVWQDGPDENPNYYTENGEIKWRVNLVEASYETTQDTLFTAIMPWYNDWGSGKSKKWLVIKQNGHYYPTYYIKQNMVTKYGLIIQSVGFDDCKKPEDLQKKAKKWLNRNCKDYGSQYTFKAIDLHHVTNYDKDNIAYDRANNTLIVSGGSGTIQNNVLDQQITSGGYTKRIHVLDKVAITYPPYMKHIDSTAKRDKMICTSVEYDIMNPENDSFTIGAVIPPDLTDIKFVTKKKK